MSDNRKDLSSNLSVGSEIIPQIAFDEIESALAVDFDTALIKINQSLNQNPESDYLGVFPRHMRFLAFAFIIACLFSGCRKKDSPAIGSVYLIPQEVKDYTYFLPGTYWIYQDSITGVLDSVYVFDAYIEKDTIELNPDDPGKEVVEYYLYKTKSSFLNDHIISYDCNTSFYKCVDNNENRPCFFTNRGSIDGSGFCFMYEFYEGFWGYSGYGKFYSKITIIKYWLTLKVYDVDYFNVVEFYDDKNITENDNRTNFFFAKNIGIIRKELLDSNQTWNLIRCNIVQ